MRHQTIEKVLKDWLTPKQYELSRDWFYAFAEALAIDILLAAKKEGIDKLLLEASHKKTNKILRIEDASHFGLHSGRMLPPGDTNWLEIISAKVKESSKPYKSKIEMVEDTTSLEELKGVPLVNVERNANRLPLPQKQGLVSDRSNQPNCNE